MIRSFDQTFVLSNENLQKATIRVKVYNANKYTEDAKLVWCMKYTGLTSWDIVEGGPEAEEIEAKTDASGVDDNHEYLILHFIDGTASTFRNSYVDLLIDEGPIRR